MKVLVANIGSTSFKYSLLNMPEGTVLGKGRVERIGRPGGDCSTYAAAIDRCLETVVGDGKPLSSLKELAAVGFKAVHAGALTGARLVNEEVLQAMEEVSFLAPAHNPPYMAAMRAFALSIPEVPLVALFETAFFDQVPEAATTYALPFSWRQQSQIRRYGFHGASHRFASERAQALCPRTNLRHISCHLGGSSSLAAIRGGVAIDCSFGMSPQSGLPQNNRAGDIDVFAVFYMMKKTGTGVDEMARILSSESGLEGISGLSGDVRDLSEAAATGNRRAQLALDVYVYHVRRYLGSFLLELGGLDILTFSGGIGENDSQIRSGICIGLENFGVQLDDSINGSVSGETRISHDHAAVEVWVIPTNEEWIVARAAAELVGSENRKRLVPADFHLSVLSESKTGNL
ncbi:MAG TPA: acetate/propionate family kinase [Terriglobia bacterium]|nr:acetate/propionate family kinase [Terriglobia bacterium]